MRMAGAAMQNLFADMGSPDFTGLNRLGQKSQAMQEMQANKSEAEVDFAHMSGDAKIAKAGMQADALAAQGQAQEQAAMGDMFSSLGGAIGGLGSLGGGSGGITSYDQIPSAGMKGLEPNSYIGTGGRYGSFQPVNMFGGN